MSNQIFFAEPGIYAKLLNDRWQLFEGSPFLSESEHESLKQMKEKGILFLSEKPEELDPEQEYHRYQNRYLRIAHWAITGRCNCSCRHCYLSAPSGNIGEYSLDECLDIIRQMKEAGLQEVNLTGGEALVHRDFRRIAEELTDAGINIGTIMSNGLLVNEDLLLFLEDLGQKPEFSLSFDGIGQHDWLRGVSGAEKAVLHAFEICAEHDFPTGSEYCLHRDNIDVLPESVRLLADLKCCSLKVNGLTGAGEAVNIRDRILSFEEVFQVYLDYIPQFLEDDMPLNIVLSGMFANRGKTIFVPFAKLSEDMDCSNYCLCGHARNMMHITADGYIVPCVQMGNAECGKTQFPNIREMSLADALSDSVYMRFIDTRLSEYFALHPECDACEYRNRCAGGCRGEAAYTGDLMEIDQKVCVFFKNGWYNKICNLFEKYMTKEKENR